MSYCCKCGNKLIEKEHKNEGLIPYCSKCGEFRFPVFSVACRMVVMNPDKNKILLIQQYGKKRNVLVAGYINKGENAEDAVKREVKEETGIDLYNIKYNKSEYFAPTNTLLLNFSCVAKSEDLSGINNEIDKAEWFSFNDAKQNIMPDGSAQRFLDFFLEHFV